jgi:nitroreductase
VDALLAIASKRDVKSYRSGDLPSDAVTRILDAGRLAGSARNRQPWRFLVVRDPDVRERLAAAVYAPENVRRAALVVAVVSAGKGPVGFDCGRAAQNMMLAAWNEGIGSTPNGLVDAEAARAALGLAEEETPQVVLTFGYPARGRDPSSRPAAEWSRLANRRPLGELVRQL